MNSQLADDQDVATDTERVIASAGDWESLKNGSQGPSGFEPAHTLPPQPIDRIAKPLARFLHIESVSGMVLLLCAALAMVYANSPLAEAYESFWKTKVGFSIGDFQFYHSLRHMVNDGLMVLFFFVIGLEVKRELVDGTLSNLKQAALPIAAAIGGMVVPALIYLSLQYGKPGMPGWGIPMATDIAFVVGCLALLGSRVPYNLRVLLLSLAIVDDIGAIVVIAIGYTDDLDISWLLLAGLCIGTVRLFARVGIQRFPPYVVVGLVAWFAFHESGVHATLAGVILGLMTPSRASLSPNKFCECLPQANSVFAGGQWESDRSRAEKVRQLQRVCRETVSPLEYLENTLHPWSSFVVMPLFALANAGVLVQFENLNDSVAIAVVLGLLIGKPLGIVLFSLLAVKLKIASLPSNLDWKTITAGSFLCGIGFTMALFIDSLAFGDEGLDTAKTGVLAGSAVSAAIGMLLLLIILTKQRRGPVK